MSQQKVDKYKEYKANRKEILAKQKRRARMTKITIWAVLILIVCAIIGGIIYANVKNYQDFLASIPDYTATGQLFSDMVGVLSEDETEDGTDEEDETDGTDETEGEAEDETETGGSGDDTQEPETDESEDDTEPEAETDSTDSAEEEDSAQQTE